MFWFLLLGLLLWKQPDAQHNNHYIYIYALYVSWWPRTSTYTLTTHTAGLRVFGCRKRTLLYSYDIRNIHMHAIIYKMRAQVAIANDANDANGHKGTRVPCCWDDDDGDDDPAGGIRNRFRRGGRRLEYRTTNTPIYKQAAPFLRSIPKTIYSKIARGILTSTMRTEFCVNSPIFV